MCTRTDYREAIRRIYYDDKQPRQTVTPQLVYQAAATVEQLFPPKDTDEAFRTLTALNLLNTAVKLPWGALMVTYDYIKGFAACLFTALAYTQLPGVSIYWDRQDDVAYFRIYGVQISFHHVTRLADFAGVLPLVNHEPQQWDGLRLQRVSVELFRMANAAPWTCNQSEREYLNRSMQHFEPPDLRGLERQNRTRYADGYATLRLALNFNIWRSDFFILHRRKDRRDFPVMRYDGQNYRELMAFLTDRQQKIPQRSRKTLTEGHLYYVTPQMRISSLQVSRYILCLTQNSYLRVGHRLYNLCLSYSMARYLSMLFPTLLFVNTLNYNHFKSAQKYYACKDIATVPFDSEARRLKVWIPVDIRGQLQGFDPSTLPSWLVNDYVNTEEYYQEFEFTYRNNRFGILAYRQFHLLPPVYKHIRIANYYAYVMRDDDKMAIYSLHEEQFVSRFIYDCVWYDQTRCAILAHCDGKTIVIHQFLPELHKLRQITKRKRAK